MNRFLSFFRRKVLRIPADRWDYQYERGEWEGLQAESARLEAVIALIGAHYTAPAILEIGCGKAIMLRKMPEGAFSTFTGIDLSQVAINNAKRYEREHIRFLLADMHHFVPDAVYDVIAFNESLYYAKDPASVFAAYLPYLKKGGSMIVSAFQNKYTAHLWPALERRWQPAHIQQVTASGHVWSIRMYRVDAERKLPGSGAD